MKTRSIQLIIIVFCAMALSSCTSLLYTSLDVMRPAKVSFDPLATNILIVNNTAIQPADFGHKTLLLNEQTKNVVVSTDSLPLFTISSLAEELDGKNFFSSVQVHEKSLYLNPDFSKMNTLALDSVMALCKSTGADVILSLDRIKVNDILTEDYIVESGKYIDALELNFESSWSVYYPNNKESDSYQFKDTLYWENESENRRKAFANLPKRENALVDGALYVGKKSLTRFIPNWEKVDRYFFDSSNKIMQQGMDSIYVKNWGAAISIWEKVLDESKSPWIKAQASNNIAITYEIQGDVDSALKFATQSYYTLGTLDIVNYDYYEHVAQYVTALGKRKLELDILKKQLGE